MTLRYKRKPTLRIKHPKRSPRWPSSAICSGLISVRCSM
jgi:hypothetical protein